MKEEWLQINGYESRYLISTYGRIKSTTVRPTLRKQQISKQGYPRVWLSKDSQDIHGKPYAVHRLVALNFISNPKNLPQVNHKDGNKLNNCVENLEWVTAQENTDHAIRYKLRDSVGVNNPSSKLTEKQIYEIRSLKGQTTNTKIAQLYGVSPSLISLIFNGKKWSHI